MTTRDSYGERLRTAIEKHGRLCVGIDPHPGILQQWGLPLDAAGLERCARTMIEAVAGRVAVVKPQSAFFEAYGSAGVAVLELVIAEARQAGLLVLLDAKRGDIDSTMDAYTAAYLSDGSPLAADAVTLSPYLGAGSLDGAVAMAQQTGRGVYLLAATSNPEGPSVQQARTAGGTTISQSMINTAAAHNAEAFASEQWGSVGLVIGANLDPSIKLELDRFGGSILAPGFGAQGGTPEHLRAIFGDAYERAIPSSSRGILRAGPEVASIRTAVDEAQQSLA